MLPLPFGLKKKASDWFIFGQSYVSNHQTNLMSGFGSRVTCSLCFLYYECDCEQRWSFSMIVDLNSRIITSTAKYYIIPTKCIILPHFCMFCN